MSINEMAFEAAWEQNKLSILTNKTAFRRHIEAYEAAKSEEQPVDSSERIFTVSDGAAYWSYPDGSNRCFSQEDAAIINAALQTPQRESAQPDVKSLSIDSLIAIWSMRPAAGTSCGEAWERGCRQGYTWGLSATSERESGVEVAATEAKRKGAAVKVIRKLVPDDGKEGNFYRDGHAWVRNRDGTGHRNIDIAPNCHRKWLMEKALCDELIAGLCYNEIEGG